MSFETAEARAENLKKLIKIHQHYPTAGIEYYDLAPIYANKVAFADVIDAFKGFLINAGVYYECEYVAGIEARGFILGSALAYHGTAGFVAIRKPNRLPGMCFEEPYNKEYGQDALQIQADAIPKGSKVVLVDDVLATGGTTLASINLINRLDCEVVAACYVLELTQFNGFKSLESIPHISLVKV